MQRDSARRAGKGTLDVIRAVRLGGVSLLVLVLLQGCATVSGPPEGPGRSGPEEFSHSRVIELLLAGEADRAETMLRARLEAVPGDNRSRGLLRQIEASPEKLLGAESFQYEVQPGESLSVLAQRFLGNYRLFFILARYNDIDNPSLVHAGQTLRIPSDYWDGPAPSREPLDREIRARELLAESRPGRALALYEDVEPAELGREELELLGDAHRRWTRLAVSNGDVDSARARLDAARRQAPDDGRWSDWLNDLEARIAAEEAYREGLTQRREDPGAAAEAFGRALEANPGHARARRALAELRRNVVPELHREAVILYRHQRLEEAIRLWNQALAIDPDFEPAQGYRTRAQELRRRLEALE